MLWIFNQVEKIETILDKAIVSYSNWMYIYSRRGWVCLSTSFQRRER